MRVKLVKDWRGQKDELELAATNEGWGNRDGSLENC